MTKVQGTGGVCPRRVLNVDPNRERCLVPELDQSKLRRVSFCVDVEIAGGPKYTADPADDDSQKKRNKMGAKLKERAEGEALKHPESVTETNKVSPLWKHNQKPFLCLDKKIAKPTILQRRRRMWLEVQWSEAWKMAHKV
jgi:hypothetical protein